MNAVANSAQPVGFTFGAYAGTTHFEQRIAQINGMPSNTAGL